MTGGDRDGDTLRRAIRLAYRNGREHADNGWAADPTPERDVLAALAAAAVPDRAEGWLEANTDLTGTADLDALAAVPDRAAPTEHQHRFSLGLCMEQGCAVRAPAAPTEGAGEGDTTADIRIGRALATAYAERNRLRAERDALRDTVARIKALFSGGPDTACRTTWPDGVECVEVPMADLRAALVPPSPGDARRETADSLDDGEPQ